MAKPQTQQRLDGHDTSIGILPNLSTTAKTDLVAAINELFLNVSNGKTSIATAITGMGVAAAGSDTFAQLSTKIGNISKDSTATAAQILLGQTAYVAGAKATGTMPNNGAVTITPSNVAQAIVAGYHNGSGTVAAVVVPAANVLTGTTIAGVAGTMPNNGSPTYIPGTAAQVIPTGYVSGATVTGDANLLAANILQGKTIFGIAGNAGGNDLALYPNVSVLSAIGYTNAALTSMISVTGKAGYLSYFFITGSFVTGTRLVITVDSVVKYDVTLNSATTNYMGGVVQQANLTANAGGIRGVNLIGGGNSFSIAGSFPYTNGASANPMTVLLPAPLFFANSLNLQFLVGAGSTTVAYEGAYATT